MDSISQVEVPDKKIHVECSHRSIQVHELRKEKAVQSEPLICLEEGKVWPGLAEVLPLLARRIQATLLSVDLISSAGKPLEIGNGEHSALEGASKSQVLKEVYSLTDVVYCKNRQLQAIQWVPQRKASLAVCCTEPGEFSKPRDGSAEHALVFWNLKDAFQTESVLTSTSALLSFDINPLNPTQVAAGCADGQVVVWDQPALKGHSEGNKGQAPASFPTRKSALEVGHSLGVSAVQWLPGAAFSGGQLTRTQEKQCSLFASLAPDGRLSLWDVLATNTRRRPQKDAEEDDRDLRPVLTVKLEAGGVSLTAVSMLVSSPAERLHFHFGTTDGRLAYLKQNLVQSPGRSDGNACAFAGELHSGAIICLESSPFIPGVFLSLGDWTFTVGRLQAPEKPSFVSPCASATYSAGAWSPSRPGVLFLARVDGVLEVWDLLEASHQAIASIPVAAVGLTSVAVNVGAAAGAPGGRSLIAVGDENGVLHVMEVARKLRKETRGEAAMMVQILAL